MDKVPGDKPSDEGNKAVSDLDNNRNQSVVVDMMAKGDGDSHDGENKGPSDNNEKIGRSSDQ